MLTNEKMYYLVKNVQPMDGFVDLDFNIVEASKDFELITDHYFELERKAVEDFRKSFRCYSEDSNDGQDVWSFSYRNEKGDDIKYVLCGYRKVRDFVTQ